MLCKMNISFAFMIKSTIDTWRFLASESNRISTWHIIPSTFLMFDDDDTILVARQVLIGLASKPIPKHLKYIDIRKRNHLSKSLGNKRSEILTEIDWENLASVDFGSGFILTTY